mmetsp:Transcript_21830/g.32416  ORF Transcript_21830/g.32416 Transcript_21830/m.32416 type:complete len:587 (+) Transcript_21830:1-1761(+)
MDEEAMNRTTTIYLTWKSVPMLPRLLSENLCSLHPGVDRLCFSVVWTMDKSGNIKDTWYGRTVIRSVVKLNYSQAQALIDGSYDTLSKTDPITVLSDDEIAKLVPDLNTLNKIAKSLRHRRFQNGSIKLDTVSVKFDLDPETDQPLDVHPYEVKTSNFLVEEYMLQANRSVAERIVEAFPMHSVIRAHPQPNQKKLEAFAAFCQSFGKTIRHNSSKELHQSLIEVDKHFNDPAKSMVVKSLCTRSMMLAKYVVAASIDDDGKLHGTNADEILSLLGYYSEAQAVTSEQKENLQNTVDLINSHYALAFPLYTHFTSPIRRYPDVLVHRLLEAAVSQNDEVPIQKEGLENVLARCNERKQDADKASDAADLFMIKHFLKEHGPIYDKAIVQNVQKNKIELYSPRYGIEQVLLCEKMRLVKRYDARVNDFTMELTIGKRGGGGGKQKKKPSQKKKKHQPDPDADPEAAQKAEQAAQKIAEAEAKAQKKRDAETAQRELDYLTEKRVCLESIPTGVQPFFVKPGEKVELKIFDEVPIKMSVVEGKTGLDLHIQVLFYPTNEDPVMSQMAEIAPSSSIVASSSSAPIDQLD